MTEEPLTEEPPPTKRQRVKNYLQSLLDTGAKTKEQILKMTKIEILDEPELEGIGDTTVQGSLALFKKRLAKTVEPAKSVKPVPSVDRGDPVPSVDLDPFLSKLKEHEDILFQLLEEHQS